MADFKGEGRNNVELIARISSSEPKSGKYVDFQIDNSALTQEQIAAGEGQVHPHLRYDKTGEKYDKPDGTKGNKYATTEWYSNGQVEAILAAGGAKPIEDAKGNKYVALKGNIKNKVEEVKGKDGNPVLGKDGKPETRSVVWVDTKNLSASERGPLTQERLDQHNANTVTLLNNEKAAIEAKKAAKVAEKPAEKAVEAETKKPAKKAPKKSASKASKLAAVAETAAPAAAEQGMEKDPDMPFG